MVITEKSIVYNKCLTLTRDVETYRKLYRTMSLNFWIREYKYFIRQHIHKNALLKICLEPLPLELYFKIKSYLDLNDLKY